MEDYKSNLVRDVSAECLQHNMSSENVAMVEKILSIALQKYNLIKESKELSVDIKPANEKLIMQFLAIKKIAGLQDSSLKAYSTEIEMMLKVLKKPIVDIKTNDIRGYLAVQQLQRNLSNSYLDTKLRYLKSFFKTLRIEGYISNDPTERITKIKIEKIIRKSFSPIEKEKIREKAAEDIRTKALVEFLLSTGCRVAEVASANISDIKDDKLIINGKGNKQRYVYLNAKAKLALDNYLSARQDDNDALFVSEKRIEGKYNRLQKGSIETLIRNLGKEIGIEKCHPHRFRRTMATDALRAGMPIEQVGLMLGHELLTTTQIYARSDESDIYTAHKKYVV